MQHHSDPGNNLRLSKRFTTELYADQLAPSYPHLKLSQIKAALVLTENNLHECRLILDLKNRFLNHESKLGCANNAGCKNQGNEDKFSSFESTAVTFTASSSSAYHGDISESDSVSDVAKAEERPPDKKVGVIIIKNDKGYKACPL
ncbi:unnamed protein product [Acanthoscelides obtectus]|uniref:Uncharacterized protein n=1 Tax=Acanthoscelides obtectus TaxID=200917 RepID=A0A9P0KF11_ACAOB|nr:unnamed protein product [Acanthoscelides obtectus]CAK1642537.1 hypothetical protein AOBTE_LOCUS13105 [Acanthoscelides obtectus]